MPFADLVLSKRLERAEGRACVEFAEARRRMFPENGAEWMEAGGAYAVFDGADSPVTQTFGLGIFEELTGETLNRIEEFFFARGANADHEVSPHAGIAALKLLCERGYRPIEVSSVMYREVTAPAGATAPNIRVRAIDSSEAALWTEISARGWSHDHPELYGFLKQFGAITCARRNGPSFLAEVDGQPGAAGVLCIDGGVALFGGSATVPELRRRGLQSALLNERMRYAHDHGCDVAMMVALPGSDSQRNAERQGFRIAYTRTKWRRVSQQS
ncbi:MAG TPA: GNAT family N-acetyltransferase [Bryobacteraceae bacterium]|nr:GNAT family N-acetyltransferase [Bryobacteraceae bacterium]